MNFVHDLATLIVKVAADSALDSASDSAADWASDSTDFNRLKVDFSKDYFQ